MNRKKGPGGAALVIFACVAWSFSGLLSKWVPWSALSIIGARALMTATVFAFSRRTFRPKFGRGTWLGALGVMGSSVLFIIANKLTTAANAIVLQYAMPVVVILASWVFWGQKPGALDIAASLIAMGGILLCFMGGFGRGSLLGDALALLFPIDWPEPFGLVMIEAMACGTPVIAWPCGPWTVPTSPPRPKPMARR